MENKTKTLQILRKKGHRPDGQDTSMDEAIVSCREYRIAWTIKGQIRSKMLKRGQIGGHSQDI